MIRAPHVGVSQVRREKRRDDLVVSDHPVNGAQQFRLICMKERDSLSGIRA